MAARISDRIWSLEEWVEQTFGLMLISQSSSRNRRMQMHKRTPVFLSVLIATTFSVIPVFAADVEGKWYGKTDVDPVIIIEKTGSDYSGSLVDIDSTIRRAGDNRVEPIHKSLLSLKVADGNVQFAIKKLITENGDGNYERDTYHLNLSADGTQLIGSMSRLVSYESADMPKITLATVTLFHTDWNSRQNAGAEKSN
jgi:hypothetical protein